MALILFGGGIADARGSVAGNTYSRNKAGAYLRNRTKPINPNTVLQSANRVRFGMQAAGWTGLSNEKQNGWDALAAGATRLNKLGQVYTPGGRQLYLESSNNMSLLGLAPLATAPINADIPSGTSATTLIPTSTSGSWDKIEILGDSVVSGMSVIVRATPPNPGPKTNFSNMYRNVFTGVTAVSYNITAGYEAVYGLDAGAIGSSMSILISLIDTATGFRSPELRLDALVA